MGSTARRPEAALAADGSDAGPTGMTTPETMIPEAAIPMAASKTAADENFPVGSALIAPRLRPHVMRFYAFARAADDVADADDVAPAEKVARLDAFEAALGGGAGPEVALALRESLAETGVGDRHARALLVAFRRDAVTGRCEGWEDLADYCAHSAHPVGRYLLDLHDERWSAYAPSDALCAALQVLNHLQDMGEDYRRLDRVYLPLDWMDEAGAAVEDLAGRRSTTELTAVRHKMLDACDVWIECARALPRRLRSRRLAGEAAAIVSLARRLSGLLRRNDPLAGRVALTRADFARASLVGLARVLGPRGAAP